jgi:cytochrome c peroxidase
MNDVRKPKSGAGNETRTRDPDLGKVVLYQLSYSRIGAAHCSDCHGIVKRFDPARA